MPETQSLEDLSSEINIRKQGLSEKVASEVLKLFRLSVWSTAILTLALAGLDAAFIWNNVIEPSERLMTEKVILAIIGASLVQVGAALAAIVYSLFTKPPDDPPVAEE